MKNYHVISRSSPIELNDRVNQYLGLGWVLIGGVSSLNYGKDKYQFCQAVAWQDDCSQDNYVGSNTVFPLSETEK